MGSKFDQIWESLEDDEYRREFAEDTSTGLAFQIRALREKAGWTQEELARRIGKRQETISLWENPNYGNYTRRTLSALANAFDVVPVFRLGSFSELVDWSANLTVDRIAPPNFRDENRALTNSRRTVQQTGGVPSFTVAIGDDIDLNVILSGGGMPTTSLTMAALLAPQGPLAAGQSAGLMEKERARALAA